MKTTSIIAVMLLTLLSVGMVAAAESWEKYPSLHFMKGRNDNRCIVQPANNATLFHDIPGYWRVNWKGETVCQPFVKRGCAKAIDPADGQLKCRASFT